MIKLFLSLILFSIGINSISFSQTNPPPPVGPIPSENQLRWQEMEYYAFVHFSLNTYTDQSWGYGNEDIKLFNPEKLDCRQWARICKDAGMKGIIITAKHHSGFSLWPSKYTEYSVKNAPWKNGKGDVVREMADACKEYGLKLGIYLSPWDRNHADYGKPEYITYFRNQLTELLTNYGPIFEVWFDGANGGTGYYGGANENRKIDRTTYYDWGNTYKLIRKLQPDIVIWNDGGDRGDLRWVGTEAGYVGETNWSLLDSTGEVTWNMLHHGKEDGNAWVPAEVNTSIRPEWFYHPGENERVKKVPELMDVYYNSIGRNGTLLLNFPIDTRGLIHENDERAALEFADAVKNAFAKNLAAKKKITATNVRGNSKQFDAGMALDENKNTYWSTDDHVKQAELTIDLGKPTKFNRFLVQEYIPLGQRVKSFSIEAMIDGKWKELSKGTTIGYKRILRFPGVTASQLRFNIKDAKSSPLIANIGIYNAPQILTPPAIIRNQKGAINILPADPESEIYYTTDGSKPTIKSKKYTGPIDTEGKVQVSAIAYDPASRKSSSVSNEKFDIDKISWKLLFSNDSNLNNNSNAANAKDSKSDEEIANLKKAYAVIDGDPNTSWHQNKPLPVDLMIDMGKDEMLTGFRYLPDQNVWNPGIISNYEFFISSNGNDWKLVSSGEFSNIKNNPLWQTKSFTPVKARYIKLRALKNIEGNQEIGYAEIDVVTQ